MRVLVTGTAGFIGFHLANELAKRGDEVVGIDCINDYYDVELKFARLKFAGFDSDDIKDLKPVISKKYPNLTFIKVDISDLASLDALFSHHKFDVVVNLAAQAGVRYSLVNPHAYAQSNIIGFLNLLECARHHNTKNFVYASSSSVYGLNEKMPFSEHDGADHPISLYAASKKSNEMMAHTYSHLFGIPTTGLRFFTVYGPWGRPDMALFLFMEAAMKNRPINVFNNGAMKRDFTYIDDIISGVISCVDSPASANSGFNGADPASSSAPFKIYNIGNSAPVELMDYIKAIELRLGKSLEKNFLPMQPGDVVATYADTSELARDFSYRPKTSVVEGVAKFIDWYADYYRIQI